MIKNKKRKVRNYSIIGFSGVAAVGAAEGIFYGIPAVTKAIPGYAIVLAIIIFMFIVMLLTFLGLAYIANIRDAELRRRYNQAKAVEDMATLQEANGLKCGLLVTETKDELKDQKKELDSKLYDRTQHEKELKLGKKF